MELRPILIESWPKLAWVARFPLNTEYIDVFHGPMVEVSEDRCIEAVWAGRFEDGDFDTTDLVFGTGIRLRHGEIVFVNSGATTDRLWHCKRGGVRYVSNSLPALMGAADVSLLEDHNYWIDIRTVCKGLDNYSRTIPTASGEVSVLYFDNLHYNGTSLRVEAKADKVPQFSCYEEYYEFLCETALRLGANASSSARSQPVDSLVSVSSGYDAAASAVISKKAGCKESVTIKQSASFWRGSDSGEEVARYLGLRCRAYNLRARRYPYEAAIWAASGRAFLVNWTQFDYPEPLCLFFTGCRGDVMWDYGDKNTPNPFSVPSVADLGMTEFRLIRGFFNCPIPFWGIRHVAELRAISASDEMQSWSIRKNYNRPIPRRIVEEAGVPRGAFAVRKKNTSLAPYFLWPHSAEASESFRLYLKLRGYYTPPPWLVKFSRIVSSIDILFYYNIGSKLGQKGVFGLRKLVDMRANGLLFHWANEMLKERYSADLTIGRANSESTSCRSGLNNNASSQN